MHWTVRHGGRQRLLMLGLAGSIMRTSLDVGALGYLYMNKW